jgi:transcriptional regulator with XRE-family HTH domain
LRSEHLFVYAGDVGGQAKVAERDRARRLRAAGRTMPDIAAELGVSRSSVSLWTRDVPFVAGPRRSSRRRPNALERAKRAQIEELMEEGRRRIGTLSEREFLVAGAALYAGEGTKADGIVNFANSDPRMVILFCAWLRHFFDIDESRLRLRLYLHQGLDLGAASSFWSGVTGIPISQFGGAYRAVPRLGIRHNRHEHGCVSVRYSCARTHRAVMGLVAALLLSTSIPG